MFACSGPAAHRVVGSALLLFSFTSLRAQEVPIRFGKLDAKEAAALLAKPTADSSAAEVLCDFGQSTINGAQDGFELRFERTSRRLIRRRSGYDHATVRVILYHDPAGTREQLQQLKAVTYNLNGKELTRDLMKSEAVFSRKLDERHDEYAFTLPNVREGSILEFTYRIRSPFLFNLQDWQFQQTVPVRWSEYRVQIPAFYQYKEITRSFWPFAVNESGAVPYTTGYRESYISSAAGLPARTPSNRTFSITTQALTRRWVQKDIPAFRPEPYLTTEFDYLSRVDFELQRIQFDADSQPQFLIGTWEQIEEKLAAREDFGAYLKRNSALAREAGGLRSIPDPAARAVAVRQLVLGAVSCTRGNSLYTQNPPGMVLELRQGNVAEVNLLLVRALREAGLDAQPLLLSTRSHGQVQTDLPVISQFNYVAAYVSLPGGNQLLLDATNPTLPAELLPEDCLNGKGRVLGLSGRWINLTAPAARFHYTSAHLMLDAKGGMQGKISQEYAGYSAPEYRQPLPALRQQWQQAHPEWQVQQAEASSIDLTRAVSLVLTAHLPGGKDPAATLYLRPLQQLGLPANPFISPERLYPVDMACPTRLEYQVELTLPPGYAVTELPANATVALPNGGGRFLYNITRTTTSTLTVTGRLQLAKTHYSAQEYGALRELYTQALAKFAEPIVVQHP
ncbi:DUF3857 domain-containing protein [Hymenobacter sp. BT175]|uniref:DUF3857 domain-containing protein n=1 Tax=Hymenobacter translucens TaxID=2886507 RepID=UPI001D0E06E3|nr:DUF3857 domain-containing protein [Hymenobacter translucens]MCC2545196.1 DUF3857 domain-containing protein [Hymenobacter translucens]